VGEGHAGAYGGKTGDLHLIVKIEGTAGIEFVNGKAVVWVEVTPATFVIGGQVQVEVLGEKLIGTMQPMTGRAEVLFRGKPLQIRASIVIPLRMSKDMHHQYAAMRAMELREGKTGSVSPLPEKKPEGWSKSPPGHSCQGTPARKPLRKPRKKLSKKKPPALR
jgi:hypothetical protein